MHTIARFKTLKPRLLREDANSAPDFQSVEYRLNNRKRMSDAGANNSRTFAIELNNGSLIRVVVAMDQADRFEQELGSAIQQNPNSDVGNLLYELTRYFDIFDMQWTGEFDDEVPVTEADDVPPADTSGLPADPEDPDAVIDQTDGDVAGIEGDVGNGDDEGMFDDNQSVDLNDLSDEEAGDTAVDELDEPSLKDVLQTMISQLQSDSEARKAEAEAKKAEAEAKKAESIAKAMEIKVGQEKEIQQMEEWEDENKEKDKKTRELERLAKFRLAKKQGITDSHKIEGDQLNEDWGSSDTSAALNMIQRTIDNSYDGKMTRQNFHAAALDAGEFYYDLMGYDTPEEAARYLIRMAKMRNRFNVTENAAAPQMMKHLRAMVTALKGKPQSNSAALDNLEDAALNMVSDVPAQRAQSLKDVVAARQAGSPPKEIAAEQKGAVLHAQFAQKVRALRGQLEAQLKKAGAAT